MEKKNSSIYVKLPVPDGDVLVGLDSEGDRHRYIEAVERIAELESETILKAAKAKYSAWWKFLLILCAMLCLILGLFLGNKISIKIGDKTIMTEGVRK